MARTPQSGARRVVEVCGGVGPGERVVALWDTDESRPVAEHLAAAATALGAEGVAVRVRAEQLSTDVAVLEQVGAPPLGDVVFGVTQSSVYHAAFGHMVIARGGRVLAMTGCTESSLVGGAVFADFESVRERVEQFRVALADATTIRITTPSGTDLVADLSGRDGYSCTGMATLPGERTGCPDVEAFIAPVEGTCEGRLVVDATTTRLGIIQRVEFEVSAGRIVDVAGPDADAARAVLAPYGDSAKVLAEFGFGLNPGAEIVGRIIEDEAVLGTGHVAFGSNTGFGGLNASDLHEDFVYWHPTLTLDDRAVLEGGRYLLDGR